jgi:hypothetical protein
MTGQDEIATSSEGVTSKAVVSDRHDSFGAEVASDVETHRCSATAAGPRPMPHRSFPCGPCPIRADNCDNPASKFPAERWTALSNTVRDPETGKQPMFGDPIFGCHKGEPGTDNDLGCAGWLAQFGADHIGVRLAVVQGRLPERALIAGDNWPPLHKTWEDVVSAQTGL